MHWVDQKCCLHYNVMLKYIRFYTPHSGEMTSTIIFKLFSYWNLIGEVKAVKADNASDMVSAMGRLTIYSIFVVIPTGKSMRYM